MRFDIFLHTRLINDPLIPLVAELNLKLDLILTRLDIQEKKIMALQQETKDLIQAVDDATNAVAAKLQKLIDAASTAGSLSEAEVRAALQPEVDRLKALGASDDNPVPV